MMKHSNYFGIATLLTIAAISGHAKADLFRYQMSDGKKYYTNKCPVDLNLDYELLLKDKRWDNDKLLKAAKNGNASAQYTLGCRTPHDYKQTFDWIKKSAEQGYSPAEYTVGKILLNGRGVDQDFNQAFDWLLKAAKHGNKSAIDWFIENAAQGSASAQMVTAGFYYDGTGVPKDLMRAYAWFNLAAAQGDKTAEEIRDLLEKILTRRERAEGQRLSSNWKKGDNLLPPTNTQNSESKDKTELAMQGSGTAFVVSSSGFALTNYHVVSDCVEVKLNNQSSGVKVITSDNVNDLALLQLPPINPDYAKLNSEPGKLRQGEDVFVFGYPLNFLLSSGGNFTPGIISALSGLGNNTNQIQITAPIQPGSSGSPVMDKKGNVLGMVSMKLDDSKMAKATGQIGQNINFAVNGQTIKSFLDANQVPYKTANGFFSLEKSNADIADEAKKWTVLIECWK